MFIDLTFEYQEPRRQNFRRERNPAVPYPGLQSLATRCGELFETEQHVGTASSLQRSDVIEPPKTSERRGKCSLVKSRLEAYFATNAFQVPDSF